MRILFYDSLGAWSGAMRTMASAAHGLAQRGHQVTFVCPAESRLERHLTFGSFEILPFPRLGGAGAAWRLKRELRERFTEVVFVTSPDDHVVCAFAARLAERAAVIRHVEHGGTVTTPTPLALRLTATGYVFSAEEDLKRSRSSRVTRLAPEVVPLGIDSEVHLDVCAAPALVLGGPEHSARHLVCVFGPGARFAAANALRVLALLAGRHPELRLTIVGAGSQCDELRMHAAALRISRRVALLGARDDQIQVLCAAEIGWVAAGGDDGAWAMLDFAALRVPVVAERSALSRRYVADGITGVILPPAQPAEAAGVIARLLANPDERAAMGVAARSRTAREYPESAMVAAFERAALTAGDRTKW